MTGPPLRRHGLWTGGRVGRLKRVTGCLGCSAHPVTMVTLILISSDKRGWWVGDGWICAGDVSAFHMSD